VFHVFYTSTYDEMTSDDAPTTATAGDFAQANKLHFDGIAHEYDDRPLAIERARRSATMMRTAYDFDENSTSVMDYACGTGLISRELAPYAKRIIGIDISQGMVDQYNMRVHNQGIAPREMEAICVQLKGVSGELQDEKFDVIVCASAFHHFASIEDVTRTLVYFLKPGGALLVVDLNADYIRGQGHHDHGHEHTSCTDKHDELFPPEVHHIVAHRGGLDEQTMQVAFEGAGLTSFSLENWMTTKNGANLFLAKGINPVM